MRCVEAASLEGTEGRVRTCIYAALGLTERRQACVTRVRSRSSTTLWVHKAGLGHQSGAASHRVRGIARSSAHVGRSYVLQAQWDVCA